MIKQFIASILLAAHALGHTAAAQDWTPSDATPWQIRIPAEIVKEEHLFKGVVVTRIDNISSGSAEKYRRFEVLRQKGTGDLMFSLRIDNGTSGSGVLQKFELTSTLEDQSLVLDIKPSVIKTYREGLFLRYDVPVYDLGKELTRSSISYSFEVDSEYSPDSILANFTRLLNRSHKKVLKEGGSQMKDAFVVKLPSGSQHLIGIDVLPYRNGTKVIAQSILTGVETSTGVIDFTQLCRELKEAIQRVVGS